MSDKSELFKLWIKHKKAETSANKKRVEVEKQLIEIYGLDFEKKSKTFTEEELGFKLTIGKTDKANLDQDRYKITRQAIPANLRPEEEILIYKLIPKGMDYLQKNHLEIYQKISGCIETKPGKPSVKVEKI